jgi:excisionase family DNA binding protein
MPARRARDLTTVSGLLIEAANYLQRGMHEDVERATGLSGPQLEVLLRLHRTPGGALRINEIAGQVTLPASSFSRLADRMEEEGLVERRADLTHRRATLLHITPDGEQCFAEAWKALEPSQQARLGGLLTDDELNVLETITRKVRDANRPTRVGARVLRVAREGPQKKPKAREPSSRPQRRASPGRRPVSPGRRSAPIDVEGDLLTIDEAAEFLSISPSSMRRLIHAGEVQSVRVGVRTTRIRLSDLDDYARTLP